MLGLNTVCVGDTGAGPLSTESTLEFEAKRAPEGSVSVGLCCLLRRLVLLRARLGARFILRVLDGISILFG